jgi:hypothetical protein
MKKNRSLKTVTIFFITATLIVAFMLPVSLKNASAQGTNVTINNFNIIQRTIPRTASNIDIRLTISQQNSNLGCPEDGALDWAVWWVTNQNNNDSRSGIIVRTADSDGRSTNLPLSPNPLNLDFSTSINPDAELGSIQTNQIWFFAALACEFDWNQNFAQTQIAMAQPICVTISGGSGGCGSTPPPIPGQNKTIGFNVPNVLLGGTGNQDIFAVLLLILNWILNIAIPLLTILIIYAGVRFMLSRGNPGQIQAAKNILYWALIGYAVILVGKGFIYIVDSVLRGQTIQTVGGQCVDYGGGSWECVGGSNGGNGCDPANGNADCP